MRLSNGSESVPPVRLCVCLSFCPRRRFQVRPARFFFDFYFGVHVFRHCYFCTFKFSVRQQYVIPEISVILLKRFDSVTFWFPIHSLSFNICKRFFFYFYFGVHVFRHCIFLSKLFLQIVPDNQLQVFARSSMIGNMISEPTSSSGVFLPC